MTKITTALLTAILLALGLSTVPAHALNTRSFISANGVDTNACTRTAPCRTLQKAHDSTNPGGEVNMLDPAGYGIVTITKAISIVNDGVGSAGVLVPAAGTGITINAGAGDAVNLRGLIVEGAGVGTTGILFNTGGSLTIENCVVRNLTGIGIAFIPTVSSNLALSNTLVANNGGNGIDVRPTGAGITARATLNLVEVYSNGNDGIRVDGGASTGTINATVTDSVAAGSPNAGIRAFSNAGNATTSLMVVRSVSANNFAGIVAANAANATLRVGQSIITGNTTSWSVTAGAVLRSYGDNYIDGNGDGDPAPTTIAKK